MRSGKIRVRLKYVGRGKPPVVENECENCRDLEDLVGHLLACHQPASRCRKCNELLAKVGMLTPEHEYREDSGGDDCFGS